MKEKYGLKLISAIFSGLLCFACAAGLHPASAQSIQEAKAEGSEFPTNITAERMRYEADKKQVIFEGSVKVRRPDFDLDSNKLTIFFKEGESSPAEADAPEATDDPLSTMGGGEIDRLIAEGQVVMLRDGRKGTCGKVTYYVDKELIVMEQNPVLSEDKNTVSGQKINFYVRENRSEVIGSETKPVKVHIMSPKADQGE